MKFALLLLILYRKIKRAARTNSSYQRYIRTMQTRILIKTADGKTARLYAFDRGKVSSRRGDGRDVAAALVWSDGATAFRVMRSAGEEASFQAAAQGKMKIEGQPLFVQWFINGVKMIR